MGLVIVCIVVVSFIGVGIWIGNRISDGAGAATNAVAATLTGAPKNQAPSLHIATTAPGPTVRPAIDRALAVASAPGVTNSMHITEDRGTTCLYEYGNVMDKLFGVQVQFNQNGATLHLSVEMTYWTTDSRGKIYYLAEMNDVIGKAVAVVRAMDPYASAVRRP